MKYAW